MAITVIATDIDGTLLNSEHMLPAANLRALRELHARGVRLVLATARKESSTRAVVEQIKLPCALVIQNGARVWDWDGHEIRHLRLSRDLALRVAQFVDEQRLPLLMTVDEINYFGPDYPLNPASLADGDRCVATNVETVAGPPTRIITVGERAIRLIGESFGTVEALAIHRYYSRAGALPSLVLTGPGATKAEALRSLCEPAGIPATEVLAIGDAEADVSMLEWAGIGVAVGNAMPEARAVADWVAPDHDDAGFAVAVERFVLHPDRV